MSTPTNIFGSFSCRIFLILTLAVGLVAPIAILGIPTGNDIAQHYQFAAAYKASLVTGNIFPAWSASSNSGLGDLGIRLYPPLSHYLLAVTDLVVGDWYTASVISFVILLFFGGLGVFLWCRELFDDNGALLAAVIYLIVPYHLNQIYNAFLYSEFAAAAILPYCFLFVDRVCRDRRYGWIGLAISYSILALTHLPTCMLASFGLLIYSALRIPRERAIRSLLHLCSAVIVGLAASSFYWIRLLLELPYVRHATGEFTSGSYDYHANFLGNSVFASTENVGPSVWFVDTMFLVTCGMFLPGLIMMIARRDLPTKLLLPVIALFCFALAIASPVSLPLWDQIRFLQYTQFPWRLMTILSLSAAVLAGSYFKKALAAFSSTTLRPMSLIIFGLMAVGCAFSITQVIRPAILVPGPDFDKDVAVWLTRPSCECWWPVWATKQAFIETQKASAPGRQVNVGSWSDTEREIRVEAGDPTAIIVRSLYYPFWNARINGLPVEVSFDETGRIAVPISSESADVHLRFVEPRPERVARWISVIAWMLLVLLSAACAARLKRPFNSLSIWRLKWTQ